jgi:hypothetical protein
MMLQALLVLSRDLCIGRLGRMWNRLLEPCLHIHERIFSVRALVASDRPLAGLCALTRVPVPTAHKR